MNSESFNESNDRLYEKFRKSRKEEINSAFFASEESKRRKKLKGKNFQRNKGNRPNKRQNFFL